MRLKNIFLKILPLVFFPSLLLPAGLFASQENTALCDNLVISQERCERNGILISQPTPIDEKIRDIILFNDLNRLEDYAAWLKENITYVHDEGGDNWSSAEQTLKRKKADCEDFAFLNAAVLRVCGYKPQVISVMRICRSHALCVFKEGRTYSIMDNSRLVRTKCESMEELSRYLFSQYWCQSICALDFAGKNMKILYKNTQIAKNLTD